MRNYEGRLMASLHRPTLSMLSYRFRRRTRPLSYPPSRCVRFRSLSIALSLPPSLPLSSLSLFAPIAYASSKALKARAGLHSAFVIAAIGNSSRIRKPGLHRSGLENRRIALIRCSTAPSDRLIVCPSRPMNVTSRRAGGTSISANRGCFRKHRVVRDPARSSRNCTTSRRPLPFACHVIPMLSREGKSIRADRRAVAIVVRGRRGRDLYRDSSLLSSCTSRLELIRIEARVIARGDAPLAVPRNLPAKCHSLGPTHAAIIDA